MQHPCGHSWGCQGGKGLPGQHASGQAVAQGGDPWSVSLAAGMLFWNFLARKQSSGLGWPQHPLPLCWPSGTPLHRLQSPREVIWETEGMGSTLAFQHAAFSETPPPSFVHPEPGFPDADPSQVGA